MERVAEVFPFRSNEYYLSLINWEDPEDPLKKIVLPNERELDEGGSARSQGDYADLCEKKESGD
jgi:lysine 2,3-aminomutase